MRNIIAMAGLGLLAGAALAAGPAQAMPTAPLAGVSPSSGLVTNVQWNGRRWGGGPGYYGPRYYGYRHHNNVGPAIGAGVLGLATGAIIGGALAQPRYADPGYSTYYEPGYTGTVVQAAPGADEDYCIRRYRSYDPASGTYLGFDGLRHPCP
jgi:hypothetical protein